MGSTETALKYADYGWIVDVDHEHDRDPDGFAEVGIPSRVDTMGPRTIHPKIEQALQAGQGRVWRTLYSDSGPDEERTVHQGRYLDLNDLRVKTATEVDPDSEFGPLEDLSKPDCGAGDIQYRTSTGAWESL